MVSDRRTRGRLPRPPIPVLVRLDVASRQLVERGVWSAEKRQAALGTKPYGAQLRAALTDLARTIGCEVSELRLDHEPPLGAREKIWEGAVMASRILGYIPDANDPERLLYRPHATAFDGSHDTKTRLRGEHGQHSDIVRIKRQRRLEREQAGIARPKAKIRGGGKLTSCRRGARCGCDRRERKSCPYWVRQQIGRR